MSHSHLAIRHLVRKLEMQEGRRSSKPQLPAWMTQFVDRLSDRFEPFSGVARVGYECSQSEGVWNLAVFLGELEIVGGAEDGELRPVNFRFDLNEISRDFETVEGVYWNAFPNSHVCFESMADLSFLSIEGMVQGQPVRVHLHAGPPDSVGPGLREHPDGRLELV
ncbi:hypothetical protein SH661x_000484 [Planctomicrobium sp. SH661]|uniref:hypothetical protein n=1 Tax=Planctomicrobium sp. SH661 TaxID=3448124 RepID=UPI003F5B7894